MDSRNDAAHKVGGDDVTAVLPHCKEGLREILNRAFKFLSGISPEDWDQDTPDQKSLKFREQRSFPTLMCIYVAADVYWTVSHRPRPPTPKSPPPLPPSHPQHPLLSLFEPPGSSPAKVGG